MRAWVWLIAGALACGSSSPGGGAGSGAAGTGGSGDGGGGGAGAGGAGAGGAGAGGAGAGGAGAGGAGAGGAGAGGAGAGGAGAGGAGAGYRIAFTSDRAGSLDLYTMRPDGSDVVRVTSAPGAETAPAWSPDGRRLVYLAQEASYSLHVVELASGADQRVDTGSLVPGRATYSPDGAFLLFEAKAAGGQPTDLYRVPTGGAAAERLTTDAADDYGGVYSPDGATIYFVSKRSGQALVHTMTAGGMNQRQLATPLNVLGRPAISPDGATLAYTVTTGPSRYATLLAAADGSGGRMLGVENDSEPAFTVDGRVIVTSFRYGASPDLVSIDLQDRGAPLRLTQGNAVSAMAAPGPVLR